MSTPKQQARRQRIEAAAYAQLKETGYRSSSLLAIARRASVSNETLYRWYGSKPGLFATLVSANASAAHALLADAAQAGNAPLDTLADLGPVLLRLVTDDRAIALNRAAAGDVDDSGTLGPAIARFGRDTIAPMIRALLQQAAEQGAIHCDDPTLAADTYLNLLIGDLQIRRVIGVLPTLADHDIAQRAALAQRQFLTLYAPHPAD